MDMHHVASRCQEDDILIHVASRYQEDDILSHIRSRYQKDRNIILEHAINKQYLLFTSFPFVMYQIWV